MQNNKKVITLPSSLWKFYDFQPGATSPIKDWHDGLSEFGQDLFNGILKVNRKADQPIKWVNCKVLQGAPKEEGIWEIYFLAEDKQQRVLGIFGKNRKEAILLIGCTHKQKVYTPTNCLDTAIARAKQYRANGGKLIERTVRQDL